MKTLLSAVALSALLAAPALAAEEAAPAAEAAPAPAPEKQVLPARNTADVGRKGSYSVGVFNPLTVALVDGLEFQTQPLLFFVAPNVLFRVDHGEHAGFRLAGEYGVYCPTPAMKLTQGYLFPTWDKSDKQVGWFLVPSAGLVATTGDPKAHTLTFAADLTVGVPLTRSDVTSPGGIAPYDDLLAPVTTGFRARATSTLDLSLLSWLRSRFYVGMSLHGNNPSPVTLTGGASLDFAVGKSSRFTLGFMWWNADTYAMDYETHQHVRSNDVFPTIDFIWAG